MPDDHAEITPMRPKWPGTMSDRERFNRQLHYQSVDRCFNREFGYWADNFVDWPIFVEHGITNNGDADIFFSFDRQLETGGAWLHPHFEARVIEETETMQILINGEGLIAEVPKDGHSTIPHYLRSSIQTPDDWARCKAERFRRDDPVRKIDGAALLAAHPPATRDYPFGVHCGSMIGRVRNLLTFEGLAYGCYDYPEMVEDMVETCCLLVEDFLDQIPAELEIDYASGWEDICFNYGPIVSLDFFKSVVVPRYQRINRKLQALGVDIWYTDTDGDVRPLIPLMMDCGLNTLFPFEVSCSGHPAEVFEKYGSDLRMLGGVDKHALGGGRKAIRAYLDTLVPLVERGGFIPFCDHRCPPNVDPDDYLFYLDLKEKMFGMG